MTKRRVIFPDPDIWTNKENHHNMNDNDLITLQPDRVAVRYGQSDPDPDGLIVEMFRIELGTDRGPFALALTPAAVVELAQHLLVAYNQLPGERAEWAARRRNGAE